MMQHKYVFSTKETTHYRFPTHVNDLVMDRADAETSEVFIVVLEPGESPPMHLHHDTEQIFYIMEGAGVLHIGGAPAAISGEPGRRRAHSAAHPSPHSVPRIPAALFVCGLLCRRQTGKRADVGEPCKGHVRRKWLGF